MGRLLKVVESTTFDAVVDIVVLANALVVGLEVEVNGQSSNFDALRYVFFGFYVLELLLLLLAYGTSLRKKAGLWRLADMLLILYALAATIYVWVDGKAALPWRLTVLRILRYARVCKVAARSKPLRDLWLVLMGLARAWRGLLWLTIILAFVMYACGAAATYLVGARFSNWANCEGGPGISCIDGVEYFGSVSRSFLTLTQLATLDNWASHVVRPLFREKPFQGAVLAVFVFVTAYGLLSVAIGVLVWSTVELAHTHKDHSSHMAAQVDQEILSSLTTYFRASLVIEERVNLDRLSLKNAMSVPQVCAAFKNLDLPVADVDELFEQLDRDRDGEITLREFSEGVSLMLRPAGRFDVACLTATISGIEPFVGSLEQRSSNVCNRLAALRQDLDSSFAVLATLSKTGGTMSQVPEVILRKSGVIENPPLKEAPRYTG